MRQLSIAFLLLASTSAFADTKKPEPAKDTAKKPEPAKDTAKKPEIPAEVGMTVAAFKGTWTFDATLSATGVPGMEKPFKGKMSFVCKPIAGGNAVECDAKMKSPMGPWEGDFMIAYDPYSKAVHFIGVTSMFEVHDHVCQWNQGMAEKMALECKTLKAGSGPTGEEISEDVTMAFRAKGKEMSFTSTSKMKGGATMTFEGTGKR